MNDKLYAELATDTIADATIDIKVKRAANEVIDYDFIVHTTTPLDNVERALISIRIPEGRYGVLLRNNGAKEIVNGGSWFQIKRVRYHHETIDTELKAGHAIARLSLHNVKRPVGKGDKIFKSTTV